MSMDFALAFGFLMSHEDSNLSGIVTIDNNGGKVRYGLNEKSFPDYWKYGPPSLETVITVIKDHFCQGLLELDTKIAAKILDMRYNMGIETANKLIQTIIDVEPDGIFGTKTESKMLTFTPQLLLAFLCTTQLVHYQSLKDYKVNEKDWKFRAMDTL